MIWLYASDNENYSKNGDIALVPNVCEIDTSEWELTLNHPIDEEGRWKSIIEGAVIKVPSFLNNDQLFRIFKKEKSDDGVEVKANPIFFDSANDTMLIDVRPTDKNGQQALDILTQNTKYSGSSDIDNISTAYYQYKNLMEALMSDDENSFINRWGGEVLYDNFNVIINKNIGEDRGVQLLYGKNIPVDGLSEETSIETVVTRIYPKAYNGWTLSNNGYVDSPLSNNYTPCVHGKVIEFADVKMREDAQENDESNGIIVCDTQEELDNILIQKCNEQFDAGIDKPAVTIKANMILLENTTEYEEYKSLETVSLGDTIYCYHRKLEIETKARVTSLVYDCIRKKTISVVIGTDPYNYFSETSSVINAADKVIDKGNNTLMADKIAGIINLLNTSLRAQKDIVQKQDVRAILFEDLDKSSPTFGALCIGTQGIQIAKKRNATDTDWQWGTAIDFQSINADYMITGILTDKNGKFYLNLDTGELRMKDGNFVGNINGGNITGVSIVGSTFKVTGTRTYNVSSGDPDKIIQAILGNYSPTAQEMMNWDIDNDGRLGASDMMYVERMINGQLSKTFNVEIDLRIENNVPRILLRQYNSQKEFKTELSYGSLVTEALNITRLNSSLSIKSNVITLGNDDFGYSFGHGEYEDSFGKKGRYINFMPSWIDSKQGDSEKVDYISFDADVISGYMRMKTGKGDYISNTYLFHDNIAGYMCLGVGDGYVDTYGGRLYLDFKDAGGTNDMYVRPRSNGKTTLGSTSYRFYRLYSSLSPDISSDRRIKEDFTQFDERYIKLFELLKPTIYKLKSLPDDKSKLAGFIAQDIEEAMNICGINKREFGIYKYDEENDSYSLVYDMFIPLMIYYIQTKEKELEIFKDNIESRLSELEKTINNLSKGEV